MKWQTKLILFLIGIILLLVLAWRFWPKKEQPQTAQNYTKPTDIDKHREGTSQEESPITTRGTRKVSITVRDTTKPTDAIGTIRTHKIDVVIPEGATPLVSIDRHPPAQSDVAIDAWVAPWIEFSPQFLLGVGANRYLEPTLTGGVSLVRLWEKLHGGADVDRFGVGVFVGYEVKENVVVFGDFKLLEWHDKPVSFAVGIGVTL